MDKRKEPFSKEDAALVEKAGLYRRMFRSGVSVPEIRKRLHWTGPELALVASISLLADSIRHTLFNKRITVDQALLLDRAVDYTEPLLVNDLLCRLIVGEMNTAQLKAKVKDLKFYFDLHRKRSCA